MEIAKLPQLSCVTKFMLLFVTRKSDLYGTHR
jgi:hypothetical protein